MEARSSFMLSNTFIGPHKQGINVLLFSDDSKFLLSGGDDERVRVWSLETGSCEQILENDNWGQITCLTWAYQALESRQTLTTLCVGSARGYMSLYSMDVRGAKPFSRTPITTPIFMFNDPVEKQAYDKLNNRLAVTSHCGELKMFSVENTSLKLIWAGTVGEVITSGLFFFGGANQSLLTIGLENSQMCCRDASKGGPPLWKKNLIGGVGSAALSTDETLLLVDNLATGNYDVYQVTGDSPLRSLPISSTRRFSKQCAFFEGSKLAVCGSDTNKVYLVDVENNYVVQTLVTGKEINMTQTVSVTPASSRRVLITAASHGAIYVWEKRAPQTEVVVAVEEHPVSTSRYGRSEAILIFTVAIAASLNVWFPHAYLMLRIVVDKAYNLFLPAAEANEVIYL